MTSRMLLCGVLFVFKLEYDNLLDYDCGDLFKTQTSKDNHVVSMKENEEFI